MVYLKNYRDVNGKHFEEGDDFNGNKELKDSLFERGIIGEAEVDTKARAKAKAEEEEAKADKKPVSKRKTTPKK